jgi:excisionase family DNA binding protein
MSINDLVTTEEAATIAGCTRVHIRRLCRAGSVECVRFGRDWRVLKTAAQSLRESLTNRTLANRAKKASTAKGSKKRK